MGKAVDSNANDFNIQARQDLIEMLTLALLRLTAWDEGCKGETCLRSWRSYDWDALDSLQENGLVTFNRKSKSVYLTESGALAGERAAVMFDAAVENMVAEAAMQIAQRLASREYIGGYRLHVEFNFKELECWRDVVVPGNLSFDDLHQVVQCLLGWFDQHCYGFVLRHGGKKMLLTSRMHGGVDAMWRPPVSNAVEGASEEMLINDVFPRTKNITYHYDYGDRWEIKIKLLGTVGDPVEAPYCIGGSGATPPEGVGGEWGFCKFLNEIADPDNPSAASRLEWGRMQGYEPFDLEEVNERLEDYMDIGYTGFDRAIEDLLGAEEFFSFADQPDDSSDGVVDIATAREWAKIPAQAKRALLNSAWCPNCGTTSFKQGYSLRKNKFGIIITGNCSVCGATVVRCCD